MSEGQSCECSKEELKTWEKRVKIYTWADECDQLLTCVWNLPGCYLSFFHCPSHRLLSECFLLWEVGGRAVCP